MVKGWRRRREERGVRSEVWAAAIAAPPLPIAAVIAAFSPVIPAKAGIQTVEAKPAIVRIRIFRIMGFSGFVGRVRARLAWRGFAVARGGGWATMKSW